MKTVFLLIILSLTACKPLSSLDNDRLYVGITRTEADIVLNKYFDDQGSRSFFLNPGEIRDENNVWDSRSYIHITGKYMIVCTFLNDRLHSLVYFSAQHYDPDLKIQSRVGEFIQAISPTTTGVKRITEESTSKQITRKEKLRSHLNNSKQLCKAKIEEIELTLQDMESPYKEEFREYLTILKSAMKEVEEELERVEKKLKQLHTAHP